MNQKRKSSEAGLPERPSWRISKSQKISTGNVCPVQITVEEQDNKTNEKNILNQNSHEKNNKNNKQEETAYEHVGLTPVFRQKRNQELRSFNHQVGLVQWGQHDASMPPIQRENIKNAVEELQAMWWTFTLSKRQNSLVPDEALETPFVQLEVLQSRPFLKTPKPYTFELPHYIHDPYSARVFIGVKNAFVKKRVQQELSIDLPSEVVSRIKVKRLHRLVRTRNEIDYKNKLQETYDIFLADYRAKEIQYFNRFSKNLKFPFMLSGDVGKDVATSYRQGNLQPNTGLKWQGKAARIGMKTENIVDNIEAAIEKIKFYFPDVRQIWLSVQGLPNGCRLCVYCGQNSIYPVKLRAPFRTPSGRIKNFPATEYDYNPLTNEKPVDKLAKHL